MAARNSTAETTKVYEVTIDGEYYAASKDGTSLKPYEITVRMNEKHKQNGFLGSFKQIIAPRVMRSKYSDYADYLYTHRITNVKDLSLPQGAVPKDPTIMATEQLLAFIAKNKLPVETSLYPDLDALRQATVECIRDEDAFTEQQDKRKEIKGASLELAAEFDALNADLMGSPTQSTEKIDSKLIPSVDDVVLPKLTQPKSNSDDNDELELDETSAGKKRRKSTPTSLDDDYDL